MMMKVMMNLVVMLMLVIMRNEYHSLFTYTKPSTRCHLMTIINIYLINQSKV